MLFHGGSGLHPWITVMTGNWFLFKILFMGIPHETLWPWPKEPLYLSINEVLYGILFIYGICNHYRFTAHTAFACICSTSEIRAILCWTS
jgi:hypothetical protein